MKKSHVLLITLIGTAVISLCACSSNTGAQDNSDSISEVSSSASSADSAESESEIEHEIAEATVESTPTAAPTPEVTVLDSLENVEAGTILSEEEIDFNDLSKYFTAYEISDELFERIYGDDKSYKTYCTVPREDLRYIKVLHRGFDSQIHVGEVMINTLLAQDIIDIFRELFENDYQIEKMFLVDNYNADDNASIAANNTSAFNFRAITGGTELSNHGKGCAIDINPINNPYVWYENGVLTWEDPDADLYLDRDAEDAYERHMINHDDLCYQLFIAHGWSWGGDWADPIDYQHFEKEVADYSM